MESLIDHRMQSDPDADPHLLRISVGVEDIDARLSFQLHLNMSIDTLAQDLKSDLRQAFRQLAGVQASRSNV